MTKKRWLAILTNPKYITINMFDADIFNKNFIFKEWLPALRNGSYKQGTGFLRKIEKNENKFCCLGVGCDLMRPKSWGIPYSVKDEKVNYEVVEFKENGLYRTEASETFGHHVGLASEDGAFLLQTTPKNKYRIGLPDLNDGVNKNQFTAINSMPKFSFTEIAEIIECHANAMIKTLENK